MSVRIKTEDGDTIVSGKGKDGKDGGGEIAWFLIDDKHSVTWDGTTGINSYMATGVYYESGIILNILFASVKDNSIVFRAFKPDSTTTSFDIQKGYYTSQSNYGCILGLPKFVVEMCNIRQITK